MKKLLPAGLGAGLLLFAALKSARADPNSQLIAAVKNGDEIGAASFLAQGADPNAQDPYGYTPTLWAVSRCGAKTLGSLLNHGGNLKNAPASFMPLIEAAKASRADNTALLVSLGYDPNAKDSLGSTAIMYAAVSGSTPTVEALLAGKAAVNSQDNNGQSALIKAAQSGDAAMVSFLLSNGAEVDLQDQFGYTALMWAAHNGQAGAAQALLSKKADVNIAGKDGLNALSIAQKRGYSAVAQLIKSG